MPTKVVRATLGPRGRFMDRRRAPRSVLDEAVQRNRQRGGNLDSSPYTTRAQADEALNRRPS